MNEALVAVLGAFVGYLLSQLLNVIEYIRRPRFRIIHFSDGVLSSYTGNPPETPWEIDLGFRIENRGLNPARALRIFVSQMSVIDEENGEERPTVFDIIELKCPTDLLPPKESVAIRLGVIDSSKCSLKLESLDDFVGDDWIDADTRGTKKINARLYVCCEDKNSSKSFRLKFRPEENDWAANLLRDYDAIDWFKFGTPMFDPDTVWPSDQDDS